MRFRSLERLAATHDHLQPTPLFVVRLDGAPYVAATDGYAAAAVRSDEAPVDRVGAYTSAHMAAVAKALTGHLAQVGTTVFCGPGLSLKMWSGLPCWKQSVLGIGREDYRTRGIAFGIPIEKRLLARVLDSAPPGEMRVSAFAIHETHGLGLRVGDEWCARVMAVLLDKDVLAALQPYAFGPPRSPGWRREAGGSK